MRHFTIILLSLFACMSLKAQDHEATIYFADGTEITGLATIKFVKESFYGLPKDKISFRVSQDDESDMWDDEAITKIVFHGFGTPVTFEYIPVVYVDGTQASLFQVIATGEVNLYAEAAGVWDTKTDDLVMPQPRSLKAKRDGEKEFANLTNKKKITTYFKGCPGINAGLESGEFSSRTPAELVTYYNENCGSKDIAAPDTKNTGPVGQ